MRKRASRLEAKGGSLEMANPATDGLKIGDYITLKTTKWECYLGAEGILAQDLYVHDALEELMTAFSRSTRKDSIVLVENW